MRINSAESIGCELWDAKEVVGATNKREERGRQRGFENVCLALKPRILSPTDPGDGGCSAQTPRSDAERIPTPQVKQAKRACGGERGRDGSPRHYENLSTFASEIISSKRKTRENKSELSRHNVCRSRHLHSLRRLCCIPLRFLLFSTAATVCSKGGQNFSPQVQTLTHCHPPFSTTQWQFSQSQV